MAHALIHAEFRDYDEWKPVFEELTSLRGRYGSQGTRVFRADDHPNEAVILTEFRDEQEARRMFQSDEFREATQKAGVTAPPKIEFLDEVDSLVS